MCERDCSGGIIVSQENSRRWGVDGESLESFRQSINRTLSHVQIVTVRDEPNAKLRDL